MCESVEEKRNKYRRIYGLPTGDDHASRRRWLCCQANQTRGSWEITPKRVLQLELDPSLRRCAFGRHILEREEYTVSHFDVSISYSRCSRMTVVRNKKKNWLLSFRLDDAPTLMVAFFSNSTRCICSVQWSGLLHAHAHYRISGAVRWSMSPSWYT